MTGLRTILIVAVCSGAAAAVIALLVAAGAPNWAVIPFAAFCVTAALVLIFYYYSKGVERRHRRWVARTLMFAGVGCLGQASWALSIRASSSVEIVAAGGGGPVDLLFATIGLLLCYLSYKASIAQPRNTFTAPKGPSSPESESEVDEARWTDSPGYGAWYHPQRTDTYRPDVLWVLVHGLMGDHRETWGRSHLELQKACGFSCDVFSYSYPAGLTQSACVDTAAKDLRTYLLTQLRRYRHIIVLAHSAGGLVTKQLLVTERDEINALIADRASSSSYEEVELVTLRLRQIVNLDVPHAGGDRIKTVCGIYAYRCLIWPLLLACRRLTFGTLEFGRNHIINQLKFRGRFVSRLEDDYVATIAKLDEHSLPRPVSIELVATKSSVIADYKSEKDHDDRFRGRWDADGAAVRRDHSDVKKIVSNIDVVSDVMTQSLRLWGLKEATAVADLTLEKTEEFLSDFGCHKPLHASAASKLLPGEPEALVTQQESLEWFKGLIGSPRAGLRTAVLTGHASVGKSVATRFLCRDASLQFFRHADLSRHLPILMPLNLLTIEDPDSLRKPNNELDAWDQIARAWCVFADRLVRQQERRSLLMSDPDLVRRRAHIDTAWLNAWISTHPTVLFLESVDEFLTKYPGLEVGDVDRAVRAMLARIAPDNRRLMVLYCVRRTLPDLDVLAAPQNLREIRQIRLDEVDQLSDGLSDLIVQRVPLELREVILKPMLLNILGPRLREIPKERLRDANQIYEVALESWIRMASLEAIPGNESIPIKTWMDSVMLIAWQYYSTRSANLSLAKLQDYCKRTLAMWKDAQTENRKHASEPESPRLSEVLRTRAVVEDDVRLSALLGRTIFFPTGEVDIEQSARRARRTAGRGTTYRLLHDYWVQFVGGRFLADSIECNVPESLGFGACTERMFRFAGQRIGPKTLSSVTFDSFLRCVRERKLPYVMGNLVATFGNSTMDAGGPVISRLLVAPEALMGISQAVLVAGIGRRVLLDRPDDPALEDLRRETVRTFRRYLDDSEWADSSLEITHVTKSMAWCYLQRLGEAAGLPRPQLWEGEGDYGDYLGDLKIITDVSQDPPGVGISHRLLQNAFLEIQNTAISEGQREISLVHYIYFLSMARRVGGYTTAVRNRLPALLAPDSPISRKVKEYGMPELASVLDLCRKLSVLGKINLTHPAIEN